MWQAILKALPYVGYGFLIGIFGLAIFIGILFWLGSDIDNDDSTPSEDIGI